jgi:hypothetical protein
MRAKILFIGLIVAFIALSGCIQWPTICGNSFCEQGERWGEPNYCPADCPKPMGAVEVTVKDYLGVVEGATVQLYTAEGKLVDTMLSDESGMVSFNAVVPGTYFVDVEKTGYAKFKSDNYDVKEGVTVKIEAKLTPVSVGMATVVIGKGIVQIADGKQYPYDPTDTDPSNDYWNATLDFNTNRNTMPAVATLKKITVKNMVQKWALKAGDLATFLENESSDAVGYGFAEVKFWGQEAGGLRVEASVHHKDMSNLLFEPFNPDMRFPEFIKNFDNNIFYDLFNGTKSYRYNGSTYEIVVKETIGLEADVRNDNNILKMYMPYAGDFNYILNLGNGIPAWEDSVGHQKFTDGDNDTVVIPFFGEEYTVLEVDGVSATKKLTLVKEQAKTTYAEGQWIKGLEGAGKYTDQEMDIKVGQLMQSSGTGAYSMSFELYDEEGRLVHAPDPIAEGTYLNETFVDSEGNYALKTIVYVDSIRFSLVGGGGGGAAP